jgi:hypothetical protein
MDGIASSSPISSTGASCRSSARAFARRNTSRSRTPFCREEYEQIAHAYHALLEPHVDQARLKEMMQRQWLPPSGKK